MKIILGVSGGIAAYKSLELTRLFIKAGHEVQVVMTSGAKEFIQPLSFQALTGKPIRDDLFAAEQEAGMSHIDLARWADIIILAPASANLIARLAVGMADDLLTTLCLATDRKVYLAPAMNRLMWDNPATQANLSMLEQRDYKIIAPEAGEQACGEVGVGRLAEPESIFQELMASKQTKSLAIEKLAGKKFIITAGPTYENIDPVRFIGNRSSGKMGYALAEAAVAAQVSQSAEVGGVVLISGPTSLPAPAGVKLIKVRSALEMHQAVKDNLSGTDIFIGAAAVADYRPEVIAEHKLKKTSDVNELEIKLVKNPDIIAWVAEQENRPLVVGFAAETQDLEENAKKKLKDKNLDMVCANLVGEGLAFEQDHNQLGLFTRNAQKQLPLANKQSLAREILGFIAKSFN